MVPFMFKIGRPMGIRAIHR